MTTRNDIITKVSHLTQDERIAAQQRAREQLQAAFTRNITREQFRRSRVAEFPGWLSVTAGILLILIFLCAALVSVFRVFSAARDHFLLSIDEPAQAAIAGVAMFGLAELLVIASTLAARLYFTGRARWLMAVPVALGLAVAFVGNWQITQPHDLWGVLDTITPPAAVLFIALIGEKVILTALREQQATERAYQEALREQQQAESSPEEHPKWTQYKASAYREALHTKNSRRKEYKEIAPELTDGVWRLLVRREIEMESWFTSNEGVEVFLVPGSETGSMAGSRPSSAPPLAGLDSTRTTPSVNGHTADA